MYVKKGNLTPLKPIHHAVSPTRASRSSYRLLALACLLSVALFGSACSNNSDSTATDSSGSETSTASETSAESSDTATEERPVYESKLMQAFGIPTESEWPAIQAKVQEGIAVCMRERGFEYYPEKAQEYYFSSGYYGSAEWAEKYAFGETTSRFPQSMVGPDLVGYDEDFSGDTQQQQNQNATYVQELSSNEQQAYYEALYGNEASWMEYERSQGLDSQGEDAEESTEAVVWGCDTLANREHGFDDRLFIKVEEQFGDQLNEFEDRLQAHPDVVKLNSEVGSCMSDKGHAIASEDEARAYLQGLIKDIQPWDRIYQANESGSGESDSGETITEVTEPVSPEQFGPTLNEEEKARLATAQAEEFEIYKAMSECGGVGPAHDKIVFKVRAEIEEEFLSKNQGAIDELLGK